MEDCLRDVLLCCDIKTLITIQLLPYRTILNDYFWRQRFDRDKIPDYVNYNLCDYIRYIRIHIKYKLIGINDSIHLDITSSIVRDFIAINYTNTDEDFKMIGTRIKDIKLTITYNYTLYGGTKEVILLSTNCENWESFIISILYNKLYHDDRYDTYY